MSALATYIEDLNRYRAFSKSSLINFANITQETVNSIVGAMDADMSPENLHCDGEISLALAQRKAQFIREAYNELVKLAYERNFTIPSTYCL